MSATTHTPSKYQKAIYEWIEHGDGNGLINAVAGSGKTTVLENGVRIIPYRYSKVYLAFNKPIADEGKARGLPAMTMNGLGYRSCLRHLKPVGDPNSGKLREIIGKTFDPREKKLYGAVCARIVSLAMAHGITPRGMDDATPLTRDTDDNWFELIDRFELRLESSEASEYELIRLSRMVLTKDISDTRNLSFDDQLYMPVVFDLPVMQFDFVMVDEAQDLNMIQHALLKKCLKPGGRLLAVGDRAQAIYGWRGADTGSMDTIKREFGCVEMPLSVCYRCGTVIVEEARQFNDQIEPADGKEEGEVIEIEEYTHSTFNQDDLVICRNNAPLVALAYRLMGRRVPMRMLGRDFSIGLTSLLTKFNDRLIRHRPNTPDFDEIVWLRDEMMSWRDRETQRALARDEEERANRIDDTYQTVVAIVENGDCRTISELIDDIKRMFSGDDGRDNKQDPKKILTLSSVHRAKGKEADRVFILDRFLMPSSYARSEDAKKQEVNIQYVAVTRAKKTLAYIDSGGWR